MDVLSDWVGEVSIRNVRETNDALLVMYVSMRILSIHFSFAT